ncbi:MAG: TonB-dependent receptor [Epsilonproteobacteria bacterium]|nr:TonB-dependent receptor [Campylobacterota bacterium]
MKGYKMAKGFKRKYFSLAAITATVAAVSLNALASEIAQLDRVVVSASKEKESLMDVTDDVEVITKEELQERGIKSLRDLFEFVSEASVASNGGEGKASSLYLRGLSSDKFLVLIDGVRFNDPSDISGARIEHLRLSNVKRVEIIKGALSGVWGADAASGVINIITDDSKGIDFDFYLGSFKAKSTSIHLKNSFDKFYYLLNFSFFENEGFSAITPPLENPRDFEADGYINRTFNMRVGYDMENGKVEAGGGYINAFNEADGYDPATFAPDPNSKNDDKYRFNYYFLNANKNIDIHKISLHTDFAVTKRDFLDASWGVNYFEGKSKKIEIKDAISYRKDSLLVLGAEYEKFESFYKDTFDKEGEVDYDQKGIYLINKNRFGNFLVSENIRGDFYDAFDNQFTGKVGIKYFFSNKGAVFANIGSAYNPPNQIKMINPWGKSNLSLEPEKSVSYDVGVEFAGFKVSYFKERVKDLISWFDPDWNVYGDEYYKNFDGESKFRGFEVSFKRAFLDEFVLDVGYSRLYAKDSSGRDLPRRAKDKISYSLSWYPLSDLTLNINGYYIGERYDDFAKTIQTGKYNVTNLSASYALFSDVDLFVNAYNVFDRRYQEVYGYGSRPRSIYVGFRGGF